MEMIELYSESPVSGKINTIKGDIPFIDWLKGEKDRINSKPGRVAKIRTNETGKYASLWVNRVA